MSRISVGVALSIALALPGTPEAAGGPPSGPLRRCAPDAVVSGAGCMDRFEASVWRVPDPTGRNKFLVARIQQGRATAADLVVGGAAPLGTTSDDYAPCAHSGQNCVDDVYAVSLPAVTPSAFVTWFQAQQACTNAGKRLPSNAEWQAAVAGTPDAGPDDGATQCNTLSGNHTVPTGSRRSCVSSRGAFDMVGNLAEWVADWVPKSTICAAWSAAVSATNDQQCLAGAATTGEPGAFVRGGGFGFGDEAGPLAIGNSVPSNASPVIGFRCVR